MKTFNPKQSMLRKADEWESQGKWSENQRNRADPNPVNRVSTALKINQYIQGFYASLEPMKFLSGGDSRSWMIEVLLKKWTTSLDLVQRQSQKSTIFRWSLEQGRGITQEVGVQFWIKNANLLMAMEFIALW